MTKDELIALKKILINKKNIEHNLDMMDVVRSNRKKLIEQIGENNRIITVYQNSIDKITDRELVVNLHHRLRVKVVLEMSSYIFLIALLTNNMVFDTSFLSYILAFLSCFSFITYEGLRVVDNRVVMENSDIDFENFDLELGQKYLYLNENIKLSSLNDDIRSKVTLKNKKIDLLMLENRLLLNENKVLGKNLDIEFCRTKNLRYRKK